MAPLKNGTIMYQSQSEWVIFHVKVLSKYSCSCLHWSLFSTNSALVLLTEGTQKKLFTYFCPGTAIQFSLWTEKTVTGCTMQRNLQCSMKIDTQKILLPPYAVYLSFVSSSNSFTGMWSLSSSFLFPSSDFEGPVPFLRTQKSTLTFLMKSTISFP